MIAGPFAFRYTLPYDFGGPWGTKVFGQIKTLNLFNGNLKRQQGSSIPQIGMLVN